MSNNFVCEYCKNLFTTKPNLVHHQKSAKYCLKLRGYSMLDKYKCNLCKKEYTSKFRLSSHKQKCIEVSSELLQLRDENKELKTVNDMLESHVEEQKQTIKDLQDKLENVAIKAVSKSTTTNHNQINNYIQKLELTTDKYIEDQVPLLTIEHIKKGPKGYAEYALKHPLNNRLICVDYSRRKVKYKDGDGNVVSDPEMSKLSSKLFESIKSRNKELIMDFVNDLSSTVEPEVQMQIMADMSDYITMVNRGAEGEKTELYHDFVKDMCSQSMV